MDLRRAMRSRTASLVLRSVALGALASELGAEQLPNCSPTESGVERELADGFPQGALSCRSGHPQRGAIRCHWRGRSRVIATLEEAPVKKLRCQFQRPDRRGWPRALGVLVTVLGLGLLTFVSPPSVSADVLNQSGAPAGQTQTNEGGGVTVNVTLQDPAVAPAFTVVLDTHTVNLDAYDLLRLSVLRTADGQEVQPISWNAPAGGHHREGTLTFPAVAADGSPLITTGATPFELLIRDVGGVGERSFRW